MDSAKKRHVLHTQARTMVASVIYYFEKERNNGGPLLDVKKVMQRVADACGISLRTVQRVNVEVRRALMKSDEDLRDEKADEDMEADNPVEVESDSQNIQRVDEAEGVPAADNRRDNVIIRTPRSLAKRKRPVTEIDDFDKGAIRRHIINYYGRKEVPTIRKLSVSLRDAGLFTGGKSSLHALVKDLGFQYKKFNSRKVLMEKPSVALLRCRFLRKMHNVDIKNTVFLDETWLNENVRKETGWTDGTVLGTLSAPLGKGKRLIVCHAGSHSGWIKAPPLLFQSKKTGDYHEDMNAAVFEKWFFDHLLPVIPPGSTVVMDNAPYHSRVKNRAPTSSSTKADIISWLQARGVPFSEDLRKPELYELVRLHKPPLPTYVIDEGAAEMGFKVIRLPPYHCHYNPIEMVWSHLKGFVKERNTTFKLKDVENIFLDSISNFTADMWAKYVDHVKNVMDEDWRSEGLNDSSVQEFIINLTPGDFDDDDEWDDDSEEDDFGCAPLQ